MTCLELERSTLHQHIDSGGGGGGGGGIRHSRISTHHKKDRCTTTRNDNYYSIMILPTVSLFYSPKSSVRKGSALGCVAGGGTITVTW